MKKVFWVEDEIHADGIGEFTTFDEAVDELRRLEKVSWDEQPNTPPCGNLKTCGREYVIIEYNADDTPYDKLNETYVLSTAATGNTWHLKK